MSEARPDFSRGLLPAIVQHADSGQVLMLGWMDEEAWERTRQEGLVCFFSRSRGRLWRKGESSGHHLELVATALDCDHDAILVQARPRGPTCHLGRASCFGEAAVAGVLGRLEATIAERAAAPEGGGYTRSLLAAGTPRIAQKLGEEGVETALAAVTGAPEALLAEAADLLYHLLVLLRARGLPLAAVLAELARRERKESA